MGNNTVTTAPEVTAPEQTRFQKLPPHLKRLAVLISEGQTAREIGDAMHLAEGTIKVYSHDLYGRFGVQDRGNARVRLVLAVLEDLATAAAAKLAPKESEA